MFEARNTIARLRLGQAFGIIGHTGPASPDKAVTLIGEAAERLDYDYAKLGEIASSVLGTDSSRKLIDEIDHMLGVN